MFRDQPEAPLLIVTPTDRAEAILARARRSGSFRVQILVPDGVDVLHDASEVAHLAEGASHAGLELLLITRDAPTLALARQFGITTLAVTDAVRPAAPPTPAAVSATDQDFLAALDDLDVAPRSTPAEDLAAAEASLAAALRAGRAPVRQAPNDDELLAASLHHEPEHSSRRAAQPEVVAAPPRQRSPRERSVASELGSRRTPAALRPKTSIWLTSSLAITLVGLLAIIAIVLLWGSRVTVVVTPPVPPETIDLITALPLPLAAPGSTSTTAVAAAPLRDEVTYSVEGEVLEGTMAPSGSAGGTVTILNSSQQPIFLPAGSEFVALRGDGRDVPFLSLADVQVPAATTSDTGAQVITSRGQASVAVQARSPGSGSNVGENSVRRITPPGGAAFSVGTGGLLVQHGPLTGGSEAEVRIVNADEVEALLATALEGMDSLARQRLDEFALAQDLALDPSTITPRRSDLEQMLGFEYQVQPPIGENIDPSDPSFSLIIRAEYSALATQRDRPLERQLGMAITEQLRQAGRIAPGDCRAPVATEWRWDGESLLVNGQIAPDTQSPGCRARLDDGVVAQVLTAVLGQDRRAAQANLDAMVDAGLIGSYTLPDVERMPSWEWQIEVAR
ncbi:hypothetical protein [Candidatus Viridilinea mediisalina]|uniref:Baseplate protein J-like domain-containing protein n=1 Tax=Candidatus Viridilinea mediisalina TaxID=2024553 RepID=A0A2A6RHW8_9CHLR|nr:hypothetical protein [Candidatus Viridilinea mediisalina]PDW02724.1 hypothetical protein CJ255_12515 [Candidatus Viridilinea mediisalina]